MEMKFFLMLVTALWSFSNHAGLKFITYNLGLAHGYVPLVKERLPHLKKALASSSGDVLCLQEVWEKRDQKKILESLRGAYPYQYTSPIKNIKSKRSPACRWRELFGKDRPMSCLMKNCFRSKHTGESIPHCLLRTCYSTLKNLAEENSECVGALMAQTGRNPFLALPRVLMGRSGLFAYEGSNGLMLLSKYPLLKASLLDLSSLSTLINRGALVAEIQVKDKSYKIMCTHLAANLSGKVPYLGGLGTWAEENKAQLALLLKEALDSGLPTLLMGDLNCGLGHQQFSLRPNFESSCRLVEGSDLTDHLAENNPECTHCSSNTFNKGQNKNILIDHIYVRGAAVRSSQVIFKEQVTVEIKNKGETLTHLSDHFGVLLELD